MTLKEELDLRVEHYREWKEKDYISLRKWANTIFGCVEREFRTVRNKTLDSGYCIIIQYDDDGLSYRTYLEKCKYSYRETTKYNLSQIHVIMDEVANLARKQGLEVQYIQGSTVNFPSWCFYYRPPKRV